MVYVWTEICLQGEKKKEKDGTMTAVFIANSASHITVRLC